jgi:hypothetical protein
LISALATTRRRPSHREKRPRAPVSAPNFAHGDPAFSISCDAARVINNKSQFAARPINLNFTLDNGGAHPILLVFLRFQ